jgi:hypothetical protein
MLIQQEMTLNSSILNFRPKQSIRRESLAAFSAGMWTKQSKALAAKAGYRAVQKFLPKLLVKGEQRELIAVKLGTLTPLIEKLSVISWPF